MRRTIAIAWLVVLGGWASIAAGQSPGEPAAHEAVERFGHALTSADTSLLKSLLPRRGKVQLRLVRMGSYEGYFSPSQVEALLRDFLDQGAVRSFRALRVEHDPGGVALARTRLELTDRQGRPVSVEVRLAFQPEDGHWVLREIRETPS